MNVYVRQLARALGNVGIPVDVFTREHRPGATSADMVESLSGNTRVIHLPAGDPDTPMDDFFDLLPGFLAKMQDFTRQNGLQYRAVHSHYWLSGWLGQRFSRWLDIPHVITFHTLSRIKMQSRPGEREPLQRQDVEEQIINSPTALSPSAPTNGTPWPASTAPTSIGSNWLPAGWTWALSAPWTGKSPGAS